MWQEAYLKSLTPLPGALDEMGLSTELLGVSVGPKDPEKWDHTFAASIVGSVPTMMEILEDTGFFLVLGKLCTLLKGLEAAGLLLLPPKEWRKLSEEGVLAFLAPFSRLLVALSPRETYCSFWGFRRSLEQMEDDEWDGPIYVEYLASIHQDLEEMELWKTSVCFKALHDFLTCQHPYLVWLASHPEAHEELGRLNFFPTLVEVKGIMDVGMEYYSDCLDDLHGVFHELNEAEAIILSPDDLGVAY